MNNPLAALTDQFLNERTYLKNVTPSTLLWYQVACKNYRRAMGDAAAPLPTKITLQEFVIKQRERGLRPVTVNTYIGAMMHSVRGCIRRAPHRGAGEAVEAPR